MANTKKLTKEDAKKRLDSNPELNDLTDEEVDAALVEIDQEAIYNDERASLVTEVWDRVSAINGVPAEHFLNREDVDEAGANDIYLIKKDGQVIVFQPHDPNAQGFTKIKKGQGLGFAKDHADVYAERIANDRTIKELTEKIKQNRTPK